MTALFFSMINRIQNKSAVLAVFGFLVMTSCVTRIIDFSIISTKNIELHKLSNFEKGYKRTRGTGRIYIIVFVPTGKNNLKEIIDKTIESVPGCVALLDGVISVNYWYIPYLYGQAVYEVEGTPLIDPAMVQKSKNTGYRILNFNQNGHICASREVTRKTYLAKRRQFISGQKSRY